MSAPTVDGAKTRSGLRFLRAAFYTAAERTVAAGVMAAEADARASTKFNDQSGKTRGSIKGRVTGLRGVVTAKGAMGFLVNGTAAHGPANARALRFTINGQVLFRKWVRGITPRPIMSEAAHRGAVAMRAAAEYYVGEAIAHAHG